MPEKLVVGNWKMNPPSVADAVALGRDVAAHGQTGVAVGVAPPAIALASDSTGELDQLHPSVERTAPLWISLIPVSGPIF